MSVYLCLYDRCPRPVSSLVAPSVEPSFASSKPPAPVVGAPSATAQTLQQAAATLAGVAGGPGSLVPVTVSRATVSSDAGAADDLGRRLLAAGAGGGGATAVNNSARVDLQAPGGVTSTRSSVLSVATPCQYGRCPPSTVPGTPRPLM